MNMNRKKATDVSPNLPQFPVGGKNMPLMHNKKMYNLNLNYLHFMAMAMAMQYTVLGLIQGLIFHEI